MLDHIYQLHSDFVCLSFDVRQEEFSVFYDNNSWKLSQEQWQWTIKAKLKNNPQTQDVIIISGFIPVGGIFPFTLPLLMS